MQYVYKSGEKGKPKWVYYRQKWAKSGKSEHKRREMTNMPKSAQIEPQISLK